MVAQWWTGGRDAKPDELIGSPIVPQRLVHTPSLGSPSSSPLPRLKLFAQPLSGKREKRGEMFLPLLLLLQMRMSGRRTNGSLLSGGLLHSLFLSLLPVSPIRFDDDAHDVVSTRLADSTELVFFPEFGSGGFFSRSSKYVCMQCCK